MFFPIGKMVTSRDPNHANHPDRDDIGQIRKPDTMPRWGRRRVPAAATHAPIKALAVAMGRYKVRGWSTSGTNPNAL